MSEANSGRTPQLEAGKFCDPKITARGESRANVRLDALKTLWFNTGTLCNLTCSNCYIESSPTNDSLVYLTHAEVAAYLDELPIVGQHVEEIAFTGGEPFMNPEFPAMVADTAGRGYRVLILTNAMRPMMKRANALLEIKERYGKRITVRVSLDHYSPALHNLYRGKNAFEKALIGLRWLTQNGFNVCLAGRTFWHESETALREGFARLCESDEIAVDATDPAQLILFPEMDETRDVPEITEACWSILNVDPSDMMCASSRMIIKRKGAKHSVVLPCTLLPYDPQFELGASLAKAAQNVALNHHNCAAFCVLGGGSCSS